jgi:hypothetical protein
VLIPLQKRDFQIDDWYSEECPKIKETVIREGSMFVSFMWQLVQHLIGNENDIKTYLGYASNQTPLEEVDDEEFDE